MLLVQQKRSDILVCCGKNVNFLKSITKINAFLVISKLMVSFRKVLRSFGDIGKKFTFRGPLFHKPVTGQVQFDKLALDHILSSTYLSLIFLVSGALYEDSFESWSATKGQ